MFAWLRTWSLPVDSKAMVEKAAAAVTRKQAQVSLIRLIYDAAVVASGYNFPTPTISNPIAFKSAASVFACSDVSSTNGGRTVRHAGSSA